MDSYKTISENKTGEGYYTEKRSKFLAFAHHVETADDVKEIVAQYRKKYFDARHVCWAYMLGHERTDFQRRWRTQQHCRQTYPRANKQP